AQLAVGFRKALGETGYVEGRNVTIEYHWLEGQYDRVPALMADLVRRRVAVIATVGIRTKLQIADRKRDLAMFNLAIDSKLRGCDGVALKVEDIAPHGCAVERATVRQKKTGVPVRFEVTEQTRQRGDDYIRATNRKPGDFLFAAPRRPGRGLSTRQYSRLVGDWIRGIGLDPCMFGTHLLRRTKATLIYRRTGNLRAVQLLLGHSKIESTARYLGIEVDDALAISEQID